jgi:hypothetical protein
MPKGCEPVNWRRKYNTKAKKKKGKAINIDLQNTTQTTND